MSFGLDPELFVIKKGGRTATSMHLIDFKPTSSKDSSNPIQVHSKTDGFALEFTNDPSSCRDYIVSSMASGIKDFLDLHPNYTLRAQASMRLNKASTRGDTPEGVCNYGCIPDRSAFSLLEKTPPTSSYHDQMRYIGGHIHWGLLGFPTYNTSPNPVKNRPAANSIQNEEWQETTAAAYTLLWDRWVGVPMVAMLGRINDGGEALRRTYYGQAGSHRVKPYGVEYRVLSGAILMSPFLLSWAMGAIRASSNNPEASMLKVTYKYKGKRTYTAPSPDKIHTEVSKWFKDSKMDLDAVRSIIDNHDVIEARKYFKNNLNSQGYLPNLVNTMIKADKADIGLPADINKAWRLDQRITNHIYPGCERLLDPSARILKTQFPAIALRELSARGW